MKKIILILILIFPLFLADPIKTVKAAGYAEPCTLNSECSTGLCRPDGYCGCTSNSHCVLPTYCNANYFCQVITNPDGFEPVSAPIFGNIVAPPGVADFNQQAGGIGIILFFSNLIKLIAVIAGLWTMLNFILAGFTYVTSADNPSAIEKIGSKLTLSVVGLGIIIASYTLAAVIGLILFGDASFIINPQIPTPLM